MGKQKNKVNPERQRTRFTSSIKGSVPFSNYKFFL
jgi:hypothetical protein